MTLEIEMLYCPNCGRECLAETPPCLDGHDDCPDRACVECATALVLDVGLYELAMAPRRASLTRQHGAA